MNEKKIHEYTVGERITGFFAVRSKRMREYFKGHFVQLELGDSSGRITGMVWEPDQWALETLADGMVVKVRATVGEYQGSRQLTVDKIRAAEPGEYVLEDILPHSPFTREQRQGRLTALIEKIENSYVRRLVDAFFEDAAYRAAFLDAAAGKLWHHAYIGGLADHTAAVTELALRVAAGYPFLDRDLLIFGGLFHDAGKVDTYRTTASIDYTDEGRLVGHICLADAEIVRRASALESFPPLLLTKLRHMVLAHQGELQYATPVVPQMPEAFVLYYCDEIDSKMGAIERIRDRQGGRGWSEYVKLIDRHLYFGEGSAE